MAHNELSRRDFLFRFSGMGALAAGAGTFLSACGGGEASSACNDTSSLTEAELQLRTNLQYVEVSTDPNKLCQNCQLYVAPAEGKVCGGCTLIKGPIAPKGFCTSWAAKQA
jgi:hypothetical protein